MIEMIPTFRTLTFLTLGLGLAVSVGRADGQTVTQPELKVMDFTNAGSTSTCIGNPVTPLCAVETFEACLYRAEWSLCAAVDFAPGKLREFEPTNYFKLSYYRYKIMDIRTVRAEHTPTWANGETSTAWQPGDAAVRLWWQGCPPIDKCVMETLEDPNREYGEGCRTFKFCDRFPSPYTYIVRNVSDRWIMVTHYYEGDHPELQGDFWNRK